MEIGVREGFATDGAGRTDLRVTIHVRTHHSRHGRAAGTPKATELAHDFAGRSQTLRAFPAQAPVPTGRPAVRGADGWGEDHLAITQPGQPCRVPRPPLTTGGRRSVRRPRTECTCGRGAAGHVSSSAGAYQVSHRPPVRRPPEPPEPLRSDVPPPGMSETRAGVNRGCDPSRTVSATARVWVHTVAGGDWISRLGPPGAGPADRGWLRFAHPSRHPSPASRSAVARGSPPSNRRRMRRLKFGDRRCRPLRSAGAELSDRPRRGEGGPRRSTTPWVRERHRWCCTID